MRILVPWVYGERQKQVMQDEFAAHVKKFPSEILLDKRLGEILRSVFYENSTYEEALGRWVNSYRAVSNEARKHLSGRIKAETLSGESEEIEGKDIVIELSRSPRLRYEIAPAYFTSFAYVGEILERARAAKEIAVDRVLLKKGVAAAGWVEGKQKMRCMAYPATFSFLPWHGKRYPDEIETPPIAPPPQPNNDTIDPGIFVTITGIPGLERVYIEAKRLGMKLYSNDPDAVPGSITASPHSIPNRNILFQFARAGWSSIWISMISGTPLVVPEFDPDDDPEIYFNNKSVEALGLGIVYRGQALSQILEEQEAIRKAYAKINVQILARWGTLDGNQFCAQLFAADFVASGE